MKRERLTNEKIFLYLLVYICRRLPSPPVPNSGKETEEEEEEEENKNKNLYILKCKVQAPSVLARGLTTPIPGPSESTSAELVALQKFSEEKSPGLPHLVAWKKGVQEEINKKEEGGEEAKWPMPGGYVVYIVMTLMPGRHLMDWGFWGLEEEEREVIRERFVGVLG